MSLDHVVETKMELQECEKAQIRLRLEALKDMYDTAARIKLSTQASIKNVTWYLQQKVAVGAGGPVEQPNGQEVTAKDAVLDTTKEPLEDVEMEDMELTPPISGVQQVPPTVQRGSKHRLAIKAAKLAEQLKDQEKIAADTAVFALALKERERIVNDQALQDKSTESVLNTPNYPLVPHGFLPENEICDDNQEEDNYFPMSHRYTLGSKGHFWFLQVGLKS